MAICPSFRTRTKPATFKKFASCVALWLALSACAAAQSRFTQADVFGGYSHSSLQTGDFGFGSWTQLNGFHISLTLPHLVQGLGITAEASGSYSTPLEQYVYAFGPQYRWEISRLVLTAHGLYGKAQTRVRQAGSTFTEPSDRQRALLFGGEVDLPITNRFSWRVVQGDAVFAKEFGNSERNLRVSTGLVYSFGKH